MTPEIRGALAAAGLDYEAVDRLARAAVEEDLAGGVDVTSVATIPFDAEASGVFVPRQPGVVAGVLVAAAVVQASGDDDVVAEPLTTDGSRCVPGDLLLRVSGLTRTLLTAERTALNLLCHLSGVATLTAQWVEQLDGTGTKVRDTRKTTPGLRALEKYAVRCGGGVNHRMSLSDAALVKDNHVIAAGGVAKAFASVRMTFPELPVEVECDTVGQVREAVEAGADLVLLDNMTPEDLHAAVEICRPAGVRTEASGGLTRDTVRAAAEAGVDFVAVGALTHSAPVLDIGLDLET